MWMRACPCHWRLRRSSRSSGSLRRQLRRLIGKAKCPWEGKRAWELARGAARELVAYVRRSASSTTLNRKCTQLGLRAGAEIVNALDSL
eukprot:417138-Pyramimonas_sp.AAC.1